MRAARKPPDADHPYGHRKFETLAAAGIFVFMLLAVLEIGRSALQHFASACAARGHAAHLRRHARDAGASTSGSCATRRRRRGATTASCSSPTRSTRARDVYATIGVLIALAGVRLGYPMLDPIGGIVIAVLIARTGFEIARDTSGILSDRVVIDEEDIRKRRDERARRARLPSHPHARPDRSRVPGPARLVPGRRAARRGARGVARGEGSADGAATRRSPTRSSTSSRRRRITVSSSRFAVLQFEFASLASSRTANLRDRTATELRRTANRDCNYS